MNKLYKTFPYAYWLFRKIVENIDTYIISNLLKFKKLTEYLDKFFKILKKTDRIFRSNLLKLYKNFMQFKIFYRNLVKFRAKLTLLNLNLQMIVS